MDRFARVSWVIAMMILGAEMVGYVVLLESGVEVLSVALCCASWVVNILVLNQGSRFLLLLRYVQ